MVLRMNAKRRVTANLPARLLDEACTTTGKGITETLVRGLEMVSRSSALQKAERLRGKIHLKLDLDSLRERPRR